MLFNKEDFIYLFVKNNYNTAWCSHNEKLQAEKRKEGLLGLYIKR